MFGRKKNHVPQKQIDSLIGSATTISGDITFTGGLRVDGVARAVAVANDFARYLYMKVFHLRRITVV